VKNDILINKIRKIMNTGKALYPSVCKLVRFEVLMAVKMSMFFCWVVALCGLVDRYQYLGEACCLNLQG
jgi:hypothetical protein